MNPKELLNKILHLANEKKYSDVHFFTGSKPLIRNNNWSIAILNEDFPVIDKNMMIEFIKDISSEELFNKFEKEFELDVSYNLDTGDRYRTNCYIDSSWYSIAMRLIPQKIPTLDELWFWDQIKEMCQRSKWLILITWPTWCWKSTNLAAMIDYINTNFNKHIITVEDPVEFVMKSKKSLVNQREIWTHTKSFKWAIRSTLREDPDVIMVWEMRDLETIQAAVTLAETWHLVFSTLHTIDSVQTIDRIVDVFPSNQQTQIRIQLSQSLIWVISQRLLPRVDIDWRIAAREIMIANDAIKNLIITKKTHLLYSVIEVSERNWMILMDKYLLALFKKWLISEITLMSNVRDKEAIEMMINNS